jgi:hypothetical protein
MTGPGPNRGPIAGGSVWPLTSPQPAAPQGRARRFEALKPVPTNIIALPVQPRPGQPPVPPGPVRTGAGPVSELGRHPARPPPTESFRMSVELDATDQLEAVNPLAIASGLHPTLAALELLLYRRPPTSSSGRSSRRSAPRASRPRTRRSCCWSGPAAGDPGQDRDDAAITGGGIRPAPQSDPRQGRPRDAHAHRARAANGGRPFITLASSTRSPRRCSRARPRSPSVRQIGGSLKLF